MSIHGLIKTKISSTVPIKTILLVVVYYNLPTSKHGGPQINAYRGSDSDLTGNVY